MTIMMSVVIEKFNQLFNCKSKNEMSLNVLDDTVPFY